MISYSEFSSEIRKRIKEYPEIIYYLQILVYGDEFKNQRSTFLKSHTSGVYDIAFKKEDNSLLVSDRDRSLLASASSDKTVRLWQSQDKSEFQLKKTLSKFDSCVWSVRFSKNGIATGDAEGYLKFWTEDGILIKSLKIGSPDNPVLRISFSHDNDYIAAANLGNEVQLWKIVPKQEGKIAEVGLDDEGNPAKFPHGDLVYDVCFSPDGQGLASSGLGGFVKYWKIAKGSQQTPQEFVTASPVADSTIFQVSFSQPHENGAVQDPMIASANSDGTVSIWSFTTRELLTTLQHSDKEKSVFGVRFSPDNRKIASAGEDRTVKLWSIPDGKLLRTYCHGDAVNRVCFSSDGKILASACADGKVGIFYEIGSINEPKDENDLEQLLADLEKFVQDNLLRFFQDKLPFSTKPGDI
jgi:WD40 repeat protein